MNNIDNLKESALRIGNAVKELETSLLKRADILTKAKGDGNKPKFINKIVKTVKKVERDLAVFNTVLAEEGAILNSNTHEYIDEVSAILSVLILLDEQQEADKITTITTNARSIADGFIATGRAITDLRSELANLPDIIKTAGSIAQMEKFTADMNALAEYVHKELDNAHTIDLDVEDEDEEELAVAT